MATLDKATAQRLDHTVDRIMRILVDELKLSIIPSSRESSDICATDVLTTAMMQAVAGMVIYTGQPMPSEEELRDLCEEMMKRPMSWFLEVLASADAMH